MSMKGYDKLPPELTASILAGGLLAIPVFGLVPFIMVVIGVAGAATVLGKLP